MRFKLFSVLNIFVLTAITHAAFKDFIIKDEKDLERFSIPPMEIYEDDIDYDLLNTWPYGVVEDGGNCDAEYKVSLEGYEGIRNGQIDANFVRDVIQQIKNDPRFKHLHDHLIEENIYFDQNDQKNSAIVAVNGDINVYEKYE